MLEPYAEGYMSGFHEYAEHDNPYEAGTDDHAEWHRGNRDYWCELGDIEAA